MGHTPRWAALRASASVATAVLLASCHGEPIGPDAQTNVPVASVIIQPAVDTLRVGAALQLVARVLDADGHDLTRLVAWQSLAPTILSLTSGGGAVGLSAGTARVVASSEQVSDTASIVVLPVPVRQVIVTPNPVTVQMGTTVQLQVETRDSSGNVLTGRAVSYLSQNTSVATVSATGVVGGAGLGSTNVTVSSEGVTATVPVTVAAPAIALSATTASFTAKATLGNPAAQTVSVTNSGSFTLSNLSVSVAYGAGASGWLSAGLSSTTAPATLTLQPITGSLAPGVYTATVTVASALAGVPSRTVDVTFTVTAQPIVALSAASMQFTAQASGTLPPAQQVSVGNAGTGTLSGLAVAVTYGAGASGWLGTSLGATTAPTTLTLQPSTSALAVGTYTARVIVSSSTDPSATPDTLSVSYVVGQGPIIGLSRTAVSSSATAGQAKPDTQTVAITNAGSGTLSGLSASVAYGSGTGWLTASVNPTTAPATLTLVANASALAAGTYTATVTIASTVAGVQSQTVAVTFTVSSAPRIALSTKTRTFTGTRGGSTPAAQTVSVTNGGSGTLSGLSVTTVYTAGSGWLNASLSGTTAPATLTVQPSTTALAAGSYGARVIVSSTTAGVAPDTVTVTYTVQQPQIGLSTATVNLGSISTGTNAATTTINVTNAGQGTLNGLSVTDDAAWITPALAATTAPTSLTLTYATGSLAAGTYTGHVIVSSSLPGVTPDTVTVSVTIATGGGGGSSLQGDPTQLPAAARQGPRWQSYVGRTLAAGGSYTDPVTGVRVWKVTSASVPASNGGMAQMYGSGPAQISRRLSNGTSRLLFSNTTNGDLWLADFTPGAGIANYRLLSGATDARLGTTFSLRQDSPHIIYYFQGATLVRFNTTTMSAEPSGLFPKTFSALGGAAGQWLQQDKDDRWFVFMNGAQTVVYAWDSQTDQLMSWAPASVDEPHFDKDGRYVGVLDNANTSSVRIWDLATDTKTANVQRVVHPGYVRGFFVAADPNYDQEYYVQSGTTTVTNTLGPDEHGNGIMHRADQWIQSDAFTGNNLRKQWYLYSDYQDAEVGIGAWTLSSGNIYSTTIGFDWTEASVGIRSVEQLNAANGNTVTGSLTAASSVAAMTEGSFYWDNAAQRLYVWVVGGGSPAGKVNPTANSNIHDAIAFIRVDGSELRLVAHAYSLASSYWTTPRATVSPDGLVVMWTSDMGVSGGRGDVFAAEVPAK